MSRTAIVVAAVVVTTLILELGARAYDRLVPAPPGQEEFLMAIPPPYADADYLSERFVDEIITFTSAVETSLREESSLPEFTGDFFNIRAGIRATTGQPRSFASAVHVFGGSTIFCGEVPDRWTIPSLLQSMLRQRYGDRWIVFNHGVPGFTARQQVERLREVSLSEGDLVIFYDGANEVSQSIFEAGVGPEFEAVVDAEPEKWSLAQRITHAVWRKLHRHSVFVRRFLNVATNQRWRVPAHLRSAGALELLLGRTAEEYEEALRAAIESTRARDAQLLHFLQPTLFTRAEPTTYERTLRENHNIVFAGLRIAHEAGYPILREVIAGFDGSLRSYDLSGALDDRAVGEEYFIDDCHITHHGNRVIARRIFATIDALVGGADDTRLGGGPAIRRERVAFPKTGIESTEPVR